MDRYLDHGPIQPDEPRTVLGVSRVRAAHLAPAPVPTPEPRAGVPTAELWAIPTELRISDWAALLRLHPVLVKWPTE
jgi:hypothetical protein